LNKQFPVKKRYYSRKVNVGDVTLGGDTPVLIQSMTNTAAGDTVATVNQIAALVNRGCDIVRVAVPTLKDAGNLKTIKQELHKKGINVPLVADVHYSVSVAERAAHFVEKVRINPGNYLSDKSKEHYSDNDFKEARRQIFENIQPLLKICKKHNTALRIGVNLGSLSKRILFRYGDTAKGMVASALEFIEILQESGFDQFTLSLKASNVRIMQEANVMLVKKMIERDTFFPLHLGVTEAGAGTDARIKSAAGIGALLKLGIGDTIRVSLTENPENEIPVAKMLLPFAQNKGVNPDELNNLKFGAVNTNNEIARITGHSKPLVISKTENEKTDLILNNNKLTVVKNNKSIAVKDLTIAAIESNEPGYEKFLINSGVNLAYEFITRQPRAVFIKNPHFSDLELSKLSLDILQGLGLRYTKTEYIACPSCGRTQFNIEEQLKKVKEKTARYKSLKIAVMGCVINGPGEMAGADYGYVGSGKDKVTLYKAGKIVKRNIPVENAAQQLRALIETEMK
jgi:(E)-4-hydroxy-3-methylbut-2-enyl-diphosphate synthase